jgi:hypothetical protein
MNDILFYDLRNLIRQYLPVVDRFNCKRVCKLWHKEDTAFSLPFTMEEETHKGIREARRRILFEWIAHGGLKWKPVQPQSWLYWDYRLNFSSMWIVPCPSQYKQKHTLDIWGRIMIDKENPSLTEWTYEESRPCMGGERVYRYGLGNVEWKYCTRCPACHYNSDRYKSLPEVLKSIPYSLY